MRMLALVWIVRPSRNIQTPRKLSEFLDFRKTCCETEFLRKNDAAAKTIPLAYGAGNDQVRALRVCAAVCSDRSAAGGPGYAEWLADGVADCLDCCSHGDGAVSGDDDEPHRGPAL